MKDNLEYTKQEKKIATWYWKGKPGWNKKYHFQRENQKPLVVILGCSDKKLTREQIGKLSYSSLSGQAKASASEIYDGPLWKTFRKFCQHGSVSQKVPFYFLVMSAKYGLIPVSQWISPYDTLLGRDVKPEALTALIKSQLKKYKLEEKTIYCFASRDYSDVLANAGVSFCYVKGGIGLKRKRLKELWVKQKLPKSQVELYKGIELKGTIKKPEDFLKYLTEYRTADSSSKSHAKKMAKDKLNKTLINLIYGDNKKQYWLQRDALSVLFAGGTVHRTRYSSIESLVKDILTHDNMFPKHWGYKIQTKKKGNRVDFVITKGSENE